MKALSVKLKDKIFADAAKMAKNRGISLNAYINKALEYFNQSNHYGHSHKQIHRASRISVEDSLEQKHLLGYLKKPVKKDEFDIF